MTPAAPLALLRAAMDGRWLSLADGPGLCVSARMPLPDGEEVVYHLRIDAVGFDARVREREPARIPPCPARHLFADGSFCMGFGMTGPPPLLDANTAASWWALLRGYLELQVIADLTGEWDPRYERAHGKEAVFVEEILEHVTLVFPWIREAIQSGAIRPSERAGRVTGRRAPCPCGSGRQVRDCHEQVLASVLEGAEIRGQLEEQAWAAHPGPCCGRMRRCPLKVEQAVVLEGA